MNERHVCHCPYCGDTADVTTISRSQGFKAQSGAEIGLRSTQLSDFPPLPTTVSVTKAQFLGQLCASATSTLAMRGVG